MEQCSYNPTNLFADGDGKLLAPVGLEAIHGLDVHYHGDGDAESNQHDEGHHQTRPENTQYDVSWYSFFKKSNI